MPEHGVITLRHQGLSQAEVETIFNMLREPFEVADEEIRGVDERYVSMISIDLPLAYEKDFFRKFGMDRWERIKELLKNLKWRRGKRSVQLTLRFNGSTSVAFSLNTADDKTFGKALETVEYLMDIILLQIDPKRLPPGVAEVSYAFDGQDFRWQPLGATGGNMAYRYVNDEWTAQSD